MPKIIDCDRCQLYSGTPNLACAVYPAGPDSDHCLDFAPNAGAIAESLRKSGGVGYYCGKPIPESQRQLTREKQLELFETHPIFTGRCPQCGCTFRQEESQAVRWDCPSCEWLVDSL